MLVVSACNEKYAPGVIALHNSIRRNGQPGLEFVCLAYGDDSLRQRLEAKGITVIMNAPYPDGTRFPTGGRWHPGVWDRYPQGMGAECPYTQPAMYARLLIPQLFPDRERVFWVDADCIVHQPFPELETLDFEGKPVASALLINSKGQLCAKGNWKSTEDARVEPPYKCHATATYLINVPEWNRLRITEQCFDLMNTCEDGEMLAVVQSILLRITQDNFVEYGWEYLHEIKNHGINGAVKIYHFSVMVPWDKFDMAGKPEKFRQCVRQFWEPYR